MSLPAPSPMTEPMTGLKRSALLMRALGGRAASVWSQLTPLEAKTLSEAMTELPEDAGAERQVLDAYVQSMNTIPAAASLNTNSVWSRLSRCEGRVIAGHIQNENPQVIALILSRLEPDAAANAVRALPRSLATEALKRMLSLSEVHPSALKALELAMEQALQPAASAQSTTGHEQVARIFDRLDSTSERSLLTSLDTAEPGAGEKIRALMFTFDDLAKLDPASLQTILGNVDRAVLTVALKGASDPVADAFFANITQRAGDMLRDEIATTGPLRRSEIEAARAEIITIARGLVNRGDILEQKPDDELIE